MPSPSNPLKRVSQRTHDRVERIAKHEDRTFILQLDRLVDAGIAALGLTEIADTIPEPIVVPEVQSAAVKKRAPRKTPQKKPAGSAAKVA